MAKILCTALGLREHSFEKGNLLAILFTITFVVINCNSDKCFGLVGVGQRRLEEDTTGDRECRVLSPAFVTNHSTSFRVLSIVA